MAETDEIVDAAKAGFGVGAGGAGAAGDAAGGAAVDHYGPGSIVLLAVDHVRVMRGETDEVVERMRSTEVERWVVGVFEDCGAAPDWFLDRWTEGDGGSGVGRMVTVACFEDAGAAKTFADGVRTRMAADEAEGRTPCVRIVEDAAWRAEEARRFSEEWARAHERGMARSVGVIDAAVRDGTAARAMVCEVEVGGGEGADAAARRAADGMRAVLDQVFEGVADPVLFSGMLDRGRGVLSVALCVKAEAAERVALVELLNCLVAAGYGFTMVTGADARRESDAVVVQIAEVLAKARRDGRRAE